MPSDTDLGRGGDVVDLGAYRALLERNDRAAMADLADMFERQRDEARRAEGAGKPTISEPLRALSEVAAMLLRRAAATDDAAERRRLMMALPWLVEGAMAELDRR